MTLRTVPLSALCPSKDNPRRRIDKAAIASLAESIKADGILQNLVVERNGDGKFRVITGSRRFLALKLLKREGAIDGDYKVPVEIRKMDDGDALRIATIENVQRADLDPIEEAEAFAKMLQNGAVIEDVSAKTGLSEQTIRRRLALADLCDDVKQAVQTGELALGIAEAMTLGTHDQQRSLLHDLREGVDLDRDSIKEMLCSEKPSLAVAIFPLEQYTGSFTHDLFATEETTYFDDIEQFFALQKAAVDVVAEKHGKRAAWVDVLTSYSVPWWQYGETRAKKAGVVIHLHPSGTVEVKTGLKRHRIEEQVAEATVETPEAPKERPEISSGLARYTALQKSIVVQAALLQQPRKAKEVTALLLLLALLPSKRLSINVHPCITAWDDNGKKPLAWECVCAELTKLSKILGVQFDARSRVLSTNGSNDTEPKLYQAIQALSDGDLAQLTSLLVLLSFGQSSIDAVDVDDSLFNHVAAGLGLTMRGWWTPDAEFLSLLRKDQLEAVAIESGASLRMGKLKSYSKKELIEALARYFDRTVDPGATLEEDDLKGRSWQPGLMCFPARPTVLSKL